MNRTTQRCRSSWSGDRRGLRMPLWLAILLALTMVAAACGSSGSNPTKTATTGGVATEQASVSPTPAPAVTAMVATPPTPAPSPSPTSAQTKSVATPTVAPPPTPAPTPTAVAASQPTPTIASAAVPTRTQQAANGSGAEQPNAAFRAVNWKTVLSNDKTFQVDPKLGALLPDVGGIFITYKRDKIDISGYPDLTNILYGNLGDGQQSAVIPVISGGSSGAIGVLVYQIPPGASTPKFLDAQSGYKLGITIQGGRLHDLQLTKPIYNGWEPNCCPSGLEYVPYKLKQGKLTLTGDYFAPAPGAVVMTVQHFYDLLANKQYKLAYSFFTPEFKQANPYQSWLSGYTNTQQITAHVAPLSTNQVTVNIQSVDQPPGEAKVTKHFSGSWTLIFEPDPYQWFLDKASIKEVP